MLDNAWHDGTSGLDNIYNKIKVHGYKYVCRHPNSKS